MIKRTIYEYDIKHTGDEMDRLEILCCLRQLAKLVEDTMQADVEISSEKTDLIAVRVTTVDVP